MEHHDERERERQRGRQRQRDRGRQKQKRQGDGKEGGEREGERERVLELETATLVDGYLMFRWTCLQPALAVYYKYISTFRRCNCANCLRIFTFTRHPN